MSSPLWVPSPERRARTNMTAFIERVRERCGVPVAGYEDLYAWSLREPFRFWDAMWDFGGIVASQRGDRVVEDFDRMPGARFFPGARLNFAENALRRKGSDPAMIFHGEDRVRDTWSFDRLHEEAAGFAGALRAMGIRPGDRVAGYVPNIPHAIAAALGAAAVGAVWSSCSPDFGVQGLLDRFGQIEPRVFVCADGYFYGGRQFDSIARASEALRRLPSVEHTIVIPYASADPDLRPLPGARVWDEVTGPHRGTACVFEQLPFDHPLYVMYSSGTTGVPKCIVHGAGGTLIQHLKEHQLHCDIHPGDRVFYFTTCGWMMWNWLVTVLASGATLLLYDGSPFHPDGNVLFDFADETGMTLFGTSAKFIDAVAKAGLKPIDTHRLDTVRTMTSTGSPLAPEGFDFVYQSIKQDIHLASISGGTDIISCFVGGNPIGPVWRGEIQARALGMAVEVFDDQGRPVRQQPGELVCTMPFPSMPVGFWNDPDGRKYHAAYFERFPGVWTHGDWVELTGHDGMIIYGRSDAVLNPGGVRIGTAEIYRQVEQLPEIVESLVIGQRWDGDERIVLFVRLREGLVLDQALQDRIRHQIRENTTPRHVPARIVQVPEIPRTRSGKIVELAVRDVVHGREVRNREALANPEALEHFRDRVELGE
ncbi:MAG TPA: acetoacetate--CoA ligase [Vicinamibacterales bacterium]|nr:acetoacetate--CoA ligase [Vicinamibacterales bacterium]